MATLKPVSARFGPHSTNTRAPDAYMRSTWAIHSTGLATCAARLSKAHSRASGPVGYQSAVTLVVIRRTGAFSSSRSRTRRRGSLAGATMRLWNAWETGNG